MIQLFFQVINRQIVVCGIFTTHHVGPIFVDHTFDFVPMVFIGGIFGTAVNGRPQLVLIVSVNSQLREYVGLVLHVRFDGDGSQSLFNLQDLPLVGHITGDNAEHMILGTGAATRISYDIL